MKKRERSRLFCHPTARQAQVVKGGRDDKLYVRSRAQFHYLRGRLPSGAGGFDGSGALSPPHFIRGLETGDCIYWPRGSDVWQRQLLCTRVRSWCLLRRQLYAHLLQRRESDFAHHGADNWDADQCRTRCDLPDGRPHRRVLPRMPARQRASTICRHLQHLRCCRAGILFQPAAAPASASAARRAISIPSTPVSLLSVAP